MKFDPGSVVNLYLYEEDATIVLTYCFASVFLLRYYIKYISGANDLLTIILVRAFPLKFWRGGRANGVESDCC